ncbi:MAG TPA: hypothetical protein VF217_11545, partial [Rhodanobacteraceae bacterium]
ARNLVSSNPVGASQVTSVVRYHPSEQSQGSYPVLFRATLTDIAFVRLALPVVLEGELYASYCSLRDSNTRTEWEERVKRLREAAIPKTGVRVQARLF